MTEYFLYKRLVRKETSEKPKVERLKLIDNSLLCVAAAWPYVVRTIDKKKGLSNNPWSYVKYSESQWAELAGVQNDSRFKQNIKRLITLQFVFSDGTLPEDVSTMLRNDVAKFLLKKKKKSS